MPGLTLEVIATSIDDAVEAARGGAHRLEVVRDLSRAGLTPPIDLVRRIQRAVHLPLRVMVRESEGFTCGSLGERRALVDYAAALDELGVGMVIGWTRDGGIDEDTLGQVLEAAPALHATFHRAFDTLADSEDALRVLRRHVQVDRVLTGGGDGPWLSRCATLRRYADWARGRIGILPGGGIDEAALRTLAASGWITEAHVGRAAREGRTVNGRVSAEAVRALVRAAGWE